MRFYVYALIDPTTGIPRYIGKGSMGRTEQHFKEIGALTDQESRIHGVRTEDVLDDILTRTDEPADKRAWITQMQRDGNGHAEMTRLIARHLDEEQAFALEAFLIRFWYGRGEGRLFNKNDGNHPERFRYRGDWSTNDLSKPAQIHPYFVYVLRDPSQADHEKGGVFYVGEGQGQRPYDHFKEPLDIDSAKLTRLRELRREYSESDIVRIVARVEKKSTALLIEALLIKFLYGRTSLTNQRDGHRSKNIRPFGSLQSVLPDFDQARVVNPGVRQDRGYILNLMVADGFGDLLQPTKDAFPLFSETDFSIMDAQDFGLEKAIGGEIRTRLKVWTLGRTFQAELRPRTKNERQWMRDHFTRLEAVELLRGDGVFLPKCWKGARKARTADELTARAEALLRLTRCKTRSELAWEDRLLLKSEVEAEPEANQAPIVPPDNRFSQTINEEQDPRDWMLLAIAEAFPEYNFGRIRQRENERSIEALVPGPEGQDCRSLKFGLKKTGVLVELRGRRKAVQKKMEEQFREHLHTNSLRKDYTFLSPEWKGKPAATVDEACARGAMLLMISASITRDDLEPNVVALL